MDSAFWWGLAAAVPLGIATNLLTPAVQRYLAARSSAAQERQQRRREADLAFISALAGDFNYYSSWLSMQQGRLLTYFVVLTVMINLPFYLVSLVAIYDNLVAGTIGVIVITASTGLFAACLNTWRKVRLVARGVAEKNGWRY